MNKRIIAATLAVLVSSATFAQSQSFKLGQWTEIQNSILKELSRSYVDSLPVDRMERAGIDAMLESLDPYTVYIPEEDNEDLQMMIAKTYGGIGAIIYKPDKDGNVIINEPYKGSPADKYGLRCGDEILEIDGQTTHGLTSAECSEKMKGKPGTTVKFKVKKVRTGEIVDIEVLRERIHMPDIEYAGMLEDGTTGYIYQSGFTENVSGELRNAFLKLKSQGMKGFFQGQVRCFRDTVQDDKRPYRHRDSDHRAGGFRLRFVLRNRHRSPPRPRQGYRDGHQDVR